MIGGGCFAICNKMREGTDRLMRARRVEGGYAVGLEGRGEEVRVV